MTNEKWAAFAAKSKARCERDARVVQDIRDTSKSVGEAMLLAAAAAVTMGAMWVLHP